MPMRRDAIALRLVDANDLAEDGSDLRLEGPRARIIGQCFCVFPDCYMLYGSSEKSFTLTIV